MHLVAGTINNRKLRQLLDQNTPKCTNIVAAIAYADDRAMELLTIPRSRDIPLTLYCRYDLSVPVHPAVFDWFTAQNSPSYVCRVVPEELHAKVIWWKGVGAYVGSANLSNRAWNSNIEAGVFVTDTEMHESGMFSELEGFFEHTERHSYALTKDFLAHYKQLNKDYGEAATAVTNLKKNKTPFFLPVVDDTQGARRGEATEAKRIAFARDWTNILADLRTIASRVSEDEFRPSWVPEDASPGAQADQFLNSVFYHQLKNSDDQVNAAHERNKVSREAALKAAMTAWKQSDYDHTDMLRVLKDWAPELQEELSRSRLPTLNEEEFIGVFSKLHAARDYFRRYKGPFLTEDESMEGRIRSGLKDLWTKRSKGGLSALETLNYVIWGSGPAVEDRIWKALTDPHYKVSGLGMSTLSEIVGWAQPDRYPPHNDRSKKALRGLGYNVDLEVQVASAG